MHLLIITVQFDDSVEYSSWPMKIKFNNSCFSNQDTTFTIHEPLYIHTEFFQVLWFQPVHYYELINGIPALLKYISWV
jgi:hypothetical protein